MKDLYLFLNETSQSSSFSAELSTRGGFITFSNSGRRGSVKYFQIGLDNILQTLKDILDHLEVFRGLNKYDEQSWRDNGSEYFTDPVANANSTVQTKPLFSTLSKVIIWANQPRLDQVDPDENIVLDELSLSTAISNLEIVSNNFSPRELPSIEIKSINSLHQVFHGVHQQIFYGAPGTGKSFEINRLTKGKEVIRTTFHPDSDYSTFVGAYKPTSIEIPVRDVTGKVIVENGKEVTENRIVYEFVEQSFLQAYVNAWKLYAEAGLTRMPTTPKEQFLIIEEINRGNCAQIFGDLFQLLDRNSYGFSDYPITADKDMKKQLAKAFKGITISGAERINAIYDKDIISEVLSGDVLLLPDNLYIWATMNTSDQSLFPIDSAFKRRWDWKYMPICEGKDNGQPLNWKIKVNESLYDWWQFVEKINAEINEQTKSEDKKLGYFFCKAQDGIISAETFVSKVIFYLWNDVFKDQAFAGDIFRDGDDELTFNKFYDVDNNGKAVIKIELVELFLNNLKVDYYIDSPANSLDDNIEENSEDMDQYRSNSEGRDNSKYSVNGEGAYGKNVLASECMKEYLKLNPNMQAVEVLNNWKKLGYIVPHFVESKEEHEARTDRSNRFTEFPCNGTFIYVERNGYSRDLEVNNLIDAVNKQNWGITLAKVEG